MRGRNARRPPVRVLLACAALACALATLAPSGLAAVKLGPPTVATGRTHVQGASVTLLGSVNPRGAATSYFFQYGATVAYGKQTTPATLPAGSALVKVGQAAPGILPGYHYRLVASNSFGPSKPGKDRTFTTSKARSKSKFTLTKPQQATVYGSSLTLSGTLTGTGNAARKIVLQESPYPFLTEFATIGLPSVTGPTGAFSFRVPRLAISTQYRVSTLDPRPVYSSILTVEAAYRVTLKVKRSSHKGIVRLYGTVTPAAVGAKVLFQLLKKVRPGNTEKTEERTTRFATQFSTTVKRATKSFSRFSTIVKVNNGGTYRARAQPSKKGPFAAGASPTVVLHSAPK
ncbi:MAG TPA: hypothetical protein VLJ80_10175 [Solirubrobacteraceae bacterium]|nr:hypothetical protein [Solirubrobacteraceae bacterium]